MMRFPVVLGGFRAQILPGMDLGYDLGQQVRPKFVPSGDQVAVLVVAMEPQPSSALMAIGGWTNRTRFREQLLRPLLEAGLLEMTIPEKPRSSRQRYRTTAAGRAAEEEK